MVQPSPRRSYRNPTDPTDPEPYGPADSLPPYAPVDPHQTPPATPVTPTPDDSLFAPAPTGSRRAHRLRRKVALITLAALALGGAWFGAGWLGSDAVTEVAEPVSALRIVSGNTPVKVSYADVPRPRIVERNRRTADRLQHSVANGALTVEYGNHGTLGFSRQELEVVLPRAMADQTPDVTVESVSAAVEVRGQFGATVVTTNSGSIDADGTFDTIRADSRSGRVEVSGTTAEVIADSNSGRLELDVRDTRTVQAESNAGRIEVDLQGAQPERVEVRSNSGSVDVSLPGGAYNVQTASRSGTTQVNARHDPTSSHRVVAESNSGSIEVS